MTLLSVSRLLGVSLLVSASLTNASVTLDRDVSFSSKAWPESTIQLTIPHGSPNYDVNWFDLTPNDISAIRVTTDVNMPFHIDNQLKLVRVNIDKSGRVDLEKTDGGRMVGTITPSLAAAKTTEMLALVSQNFLPDESKTKGTPFDVVNESVPLGHYLRSFVCKHDLKGSTEVLDNLVACDVMNRCPEKPFHSVNEQCSALVAQGLDKNDFLDMDDDDDDDPNVETSPFFIVISDGDVGLFSVIKSSYESDEIKNTVEQECGGLRTELVGASFDDVDIEYARIVIDDKSYEVPRRLMRSLWSKVVNRKFGSPSSYSLSVSRSVMYGCEVPAESVVGPQLQKAMSFSISDFTSLRPATAFDDSLPPSQRKWGFLSQ